MAEEARDADANAATGGDEAVEDASASVSQPDVAVADETMDQD